MKLVRVIGSLVSTEKGKKFQFHFGTVVIAFILGDYFTKNIIKRTFVHVSAKQMLYSSARRRLKKSHRTGNYFFEQIVV